VIEWMSDRFGFLPTEAIIALLLAAGVGLGLKFVRGGPFVRAVGFGELPSLIAGVPTKAVKVIVFTLSGTMAGLAGVILASQNIGGDPGSAQSLLMPSIAAVLVGGTLITGGRGGLGRTVLGVAVIIVLRNGLAVMGVPDSYTQLIYGTVVIVAVALSVDRTPGRIVA
jgi:ribose transport system permease protein